MNKYEELIYSLIYNCKREINKEEMEILNQADAIYNTYNQLTEQLGCPLDVREQALKQDEIFYIEKNQNKMIRVVAMNCGYINNGECVLNCLANGIWFCLPVKDYKKTWWLREDKSE